MSGSFPKACIIVLVVLGLLVMADLIPRMVILATEARETTYWESWEEAYIDQESGKHYLPETLHLRKPLHDCVRAGTVNVPSLSTASAICTC